MPKKVQEFSLHLSLTGPVLGQGMARSSLFKRIRMHPAAVLKGKFDRSSIKGRYPGKTTTKAMIVMASSAAQTKAIVAARLWALARLFPIRRALDVRVPNIVQPL
jgi:hypothetical protein